MVPPRFYLFLSVWGDLLRVGQGALSSVLVHIAVFHRYVYVFLSVWGDLLRVGQGALSSVLVHIAVLHSKSAKPVFSISEMLNHQKNNLPKSPYTILFAMRNGTPERDGVGVTIGGEGGGVGCIPQIWK